MRSGWCSWKFSICHTSQHFGQRPSAKHSILPHNVVRHRPWRGSRCAPRSACEAFEEERPQLIGYRLRPRPAARAKVSIP